MDDIINDIKQQLYSTADRLRQSPNDEKLKADALALIDAINVLERHEYGRVITDEWGL